MKKSKAKADCEHCQIDMAKPHADECEHCGQKDSLVNCLHCGHVCCHEGTMDHARAHAKKTGHAIIQSLPVSDNTFMWCYTCDAYLE